MVKVGVVLSGCGVFDGAEVHESVLTLLALDSAGAEAVCAAPDVEQMHVIDHSSGEETGETRNVLVESARIARGEILELSRLGAADVDAVIFPGGFGAAKNLCDFAVSGAECTVNPDVARLVGEMLAAEKPIAAVCIAPAMLAAVLRDAGLEGELTIGNDAATAGTLEAMGARHLACPVDEFRVDETHRIVTSPAYMLAGGIAELARGIERTVGELLRLAG
ncbi:MAG: isoprenoid biosynthesis glyoxalase ElbB [Planctomycetota bacterium]|jgi:enhancing lycopene biosynthesis protein 2|nr:isoprenoid biosynthesis glyoxalase ElbB [Planctomycetota bacterium]MDP6763528.1 isoprenoid biosynthesis glyoxalase ElbB [Planctomycetota bacterium]MDP6988153.1 isoprenoid biosynthesis glyoxalase ElbB [Planctomycetota bacterium]